MKQREIKMVVTTFYSNGKAIWRKEYPNMLTDDDIAKENEEIRAGGYGEVDAITDTTGRMITFVNGGFLKEAE